jgi:hypothetical protein
MRFNSRTSRRSFALASALLVASACGSETSAPPPKAECLVSDDCSDGLACIDGSCQPAPVGDGGDSGLGGAGGDSGLDPIILSGAGGALGEESCVDICDAARHCPGVNPRYDCEQSCSESAELVSATRCEAEWSVVLRCPVERGPCAACQKQLTLLNQCLEGFCVDEPDSPYCKP